MSHGPMEQIEKHGFEGKSHLAFDAGKDYRAEKELESRACLRIDKIVDHCKGLDLSERTALKSMEKALVKGDFARLCSLVETCHDKKVIDQFLKDIKKAGLEASFDGGQLLVIREKSGSHFAQIWNIKGANRNCANQEVGIIKNELQIDPLSGKQSSQMKSEEEKMGCSLKEMGKHFAKQFSQQQKR